MLKKACLFFWAGNYNSWRFDTATLDNLPI